jgi:hypothetical protein
MLSKQISNAFMLMKMTVEGIHKSFFSTFPPVHTR